jgi:hypothetical protein
MTPEQIRELVIQILEERERDELIAQQAKF